MKETSKVKLLTLALLIALCATQSTSSVRFGIISRNDSASIPLKDLQFNIHTIDGLMSVEIVQTYANDRANPIDAFYVFPINYKMAVTNFSISYSHDPEAVMYGRLFPRKLANDIYENMTEAGHGAAQMVYDENLGDLLTLELGNIPSRNTVKVRVSFIELLQVEDLSWAIRIPTTFTPPYHSWNFSYSEPAASSTPTTSEEIYTMSLNLMIDSSSQITRLVSPSHDISTKFAFQNRKAMVNFKNPNERPNKDIIILYRNSRISQPQVVVQKSPKFDTYAMMISLLPFAESQFKDEIDTDPKKTYYQTNNFLEAKQEFVFLIDCSGSMAGRIGQAKEAAKLFVKSLPKDSYFSFVFFGSEFRVADPGEPVKYTKESIETAWKYLDELDANMGGTEIYQALDYILRMPHIKGYNRNILIMTDGEVTNTQKVIELVKNGTERLDTTVNSIGIGTGASRYLVEGVAEAGKGVSYFITDGEAIMPKVIEALANMCMHKMTNIRVSWGNSEALELKDESKVGLYNRPMVFMAIFGEKPSGKIEIAGYSTKDEKDTKLVIDVSEANNIQGEEIYQLALKSAINHESIKAPELIEELSMAYSVLTEETSFVAVKFYPNRVDRKEVEEVKIPVLIVKEAFAFANVTTSMMFMDYPDYVSYNEDLWVERFKSDQNSTIQDEELLDVIKLQDLEGWFTHDREKIKKYLRNSLAEIRQAFSKEILAMLSNDVDDKKLNTVAMIYVIDTNFQQSSEASWIRIKAIIWLESEGVKYDEIKGELELFLKRKPDL